MAIEAISKSAVAYQGSVSAPEAPKVSSVEKTGGNPVNTESPARDYAGTVVASESNESVNVRADDDSSVKMNSDSMKKAVEEINKNMKNSAAVFGIHDKTNRVTIKIIDKDTKEVLKEFPPEKTLDMIAKVWEMAGLMVDERG